MLWTIMPEAAVFDDTPPTRPAEYRYQNRRVLCCPMENNTFCILRLISSNPRDYLDRRFQPGTLVSANDASFMKIM